MCGLFVTLGTSITTAQIDVLRHRGPDGAGRREFVTAAGPLVLGHRRLAIIDLDPRSDQPLASADDRAHIVFNGEIYNHNELREELLAVGVQFRTMSDTEVVLAGYRTWGHGVVARLIGMFAFVIADLEKGVLFIARDQFGIKPLYMSSGSGRFACASEIKALLTLDFVSRRVHPAAASRFLVDGSIEDCEETLFADIVSLAPAHWQEVSLATAKAGPAQRYWSPTQVSDCGGVGWAAMLRRQFERSLELHLVSDVPVGATLSGGLDSTTIVASIARKLEPGCRLSTYTYICEDESLSEEGWVDALTREIQIEPHKVRARFEDFEAEIDRVILAQDIPLQGPSIYAEYKTFELVKRIGGKVVLGGQGSDELFAGYYPYACFRIFSLLRMGRIGSARRLASAYLERSRSSWVPLLRELVALALPAALINRSKRRLPAWLDAGWFERAEVRHEPLWRPNGHDTLRSRLRHDVLEGSLRAHLRYEDHNSMAHGVESRVPFVTCAMAELAFSLPEDQLISQEAVTKQVLRAAFEDRLPDAIRNRRDKIGFEAPDVAWLVRFAPSLARKLQDLPDVLGPIRIDQLRHRWLAMAEGRLPMCKSIWRSYFFARWARMMDVQFQ